MSAAQQQKIRRIVWTGAITSVTATGAWYGAGLKTKSELKQVIPSFLANVHISSLPSCGDEIKEFSLIEWGHR